MSDCPWIFAIDIRSIGGWLLSLSTTYLATAIAILLLTGTIGIGNKGNILTDEQTGWEKTFGKEIQWLITICRFIYAGNMILLL